MAALLRAAAARAQAAGEAEGPQSNAVLRMLGKRAAERSPSVSPAKAERDSAPEPHEKVPFQLGELNESMDELGEGGEQPAAEGKRSAGNRQGTDLSRWEERVEEDSIKSQIMRGCAKGCNCVFAFGLIMLSFITAERKRMSELSAACRRSWVRAYLDDHRSESSKSGFYFDWGVLEKPACMIGFSLRTGLPSSFLYARMRDVRMGIMADDGNLGGLRIKGEFTGEESETSPKVMAAMGWFRGLVLELEPMPNSDLHEIDHIEIGVLYKECLMDLSAAGCDEKDLPSQALWRNVWQQHFPKLRRRVHRAVDSKDKVRAELRRLLRTKKHNTTQGRAYLRGLRAAYHGSIRRERCFYWTDRLKPADEPLIYLTYIQDGATQSFYKLPWYLDTDVGRSGAQFKLVGNLFHGHALILHLVHPHVPDDANLCCHCLDDSLEALIDVRVEKDQPDFLPPKFRIQIDGVGTNWGKTTLAHIEHLARCGVVDEINTCRNPVGNTHEDIDAVFSHIRQKIMHDNIMTLSQLEKVVMSAFPGGKLGGKIPVIIRHVDCTFDYAEYYKPHIDPKLANFSYSDHQSGYHVFKVRKQEDGTVLDFFKKYQQDAFLTIATCRSHLTLVPPADRPPLGSDFKPVKLIIKNDYEPATVLLSVPAGDPSIAELPEYDWDTVLGDCLHLIGDIEENAPMRTEWRDWVGDRPRSVADVEARFKSMLPRPIDKLPKRPVVPTDIRGGAAAAPDAYIVQQPRTVASSLHSGREGDDAREQGNRDRAAADLAETAGRLDPLTPSDFVMIGMTYTNTDGFQIPWLVGQLPNDFKGKDTRDGRLRIAVKWWESHNGKYKGEWQPWKNDEGEQWDGAVHGDGHCVDRAGIQAISAKFTQVQPNKNGRWKLNGATLRMIEMSDSDSHCKIKPQWGRFK
jgi:hypothetical protein